MAALQPKAGQIFGLQAPSPQVLIPALAARAASQPGQLRRPRYQRGQPRTNICTGPVPGGPSQLVCGKPLAWLGAVIISDAENGDAEARIDSVDDAEPFGFDDKDTIAKLELSIHRSASIAMLGPPGSF